MREYKLVFLNKGLRFSREDDLEAATKMINEYSENGWTLQQVISPNDLGGAIVGVFYREKQ